MADDAENQSPTTTERPAGAARSPLIIGMIAYGLLGWMVLLTLALIAWKLFG